MSTVTTDADPQLAEDDARWARVHAAAQDAARRWGPGPPSRELFEELYDELGVPR